MVTTYWTAANDRFSPMTAGRRDAHPLSQLWDTAIGLKASLALSAGLWLIRSLGISHSPLAATIAFIFGAGLSLAYLSSFQGPPQSVNRQKNCAAHEPYHSATTP